MPTRIWEFLAGTLTFVFNERIKNILQKFKNYFFDFLFFILVCFILFYRIDLYHPSILTLIPVIITSILIVKSENQIISDKVLNSKVSIFLGNISYSLYLWHFPIIVYLRYNNLERLNFSYSYINHTNFYYFCNFFLFYRKLF